MGLIIRDIKRTKSMKAFNQEIDTVAISFNAVHQVHEKEIMLFLYQRTITIIL